MLKADLSLIDDKLVLACAKILKIVKPHSYSIEGEWKLGKLLNKISQDIKFDKMEHIHSKWSGGYEIRQYLCEKKGFQSMLVLTCRESDDGDSYNNTVVEKLLFVGIEGNQTTTKKAQFEGILGECEVNPVAPGTIRFKLHTIGVGLSGLEIAKRDFIFKRLTNASSKQLYNHNNYLKSNGYKVDGVDLIGSLNALLETATNNGNAVVHTSGHSSYFLTEVINIFSRKLKKDIFYISGEMLVRLMESPEGMSVLHSINNAVVIVSKLSNVSNPFMDELLDNPTNSWIIEGDKLNFVKPNNISFQLGLSKYHKNDATAIAKIICDEFNYKHNGIKVRTTFVSYNDIMDLCEPITAPEERLELKDIKNPPRSKGKSEKKGRVNKADKAKEKVKEEVKIENLIQM